MKALSKETVVRALLWSIDVKEKVEKLMEGV